MANIAFLMGKVSNIGGIGRVVSLISDSLVDRSDHTISIISFLPEWAENYNWNPSIHFFHLLDRPTNMKKGIFKAVSRLRKILSSEKIDILVSCDSQYGPLGVLATRFIKTKMVYWPHTNYFENHAHQFKNESKILSSKFANRVVSLTKTDVPNYQKHNKDEHVIQIYNPIDPKLLEKEKKFDADSNKIISVGRLTYLKNFAGLVDVAKLVDKTSIEFEWHIFGEGSERKNIEEKIQQLGLGHRVMLKGLSTDLYNRYNDYSMMVVTSISEGFPMTLLEGMASNLPLISYDIATGPNEIIRHGENGFLIEANNIEVMAEKIIELLRSKEKRKKFSAAQHKYLSHYSIDSITNQWCSLIDDLTLK